jgi:hypothetical protein
MPAASSFQGIPSQPIRERSEEIKGTRNYWNDVHGAEQRDLLL